MTNPRQTTSGGFFRTRTGWVLLAFVAIAGFFLVTEHTAHVYGALPYLFRFLCLFFLHRFMHGGHGGHGGAGGGDDPHAGHRVSQPSGGGQR